MAGLGIGAGAFEGDNARKEQQQRDAQLGLQAASLQQQGRQADMADSRARMGMALDQQNRKAELAFGQQRLGEQARQFDAGLGMDQQRQAEQRRQFDVGTQLQTQEQQRRAQMDAFGQSQALRQNDWEDVLNAVKVREADLQYQELLKLRDEEEKQRQQRDQVAKSAVGQMIRAAYEGGGVPGKNFLSASQMDYFRKADPRFAGLQSVTWGDDGQGNKVLQMVHQGQDGQPVAEIITPEQQFLALSSIYGEKMANGIFGRTDKAAYNAYLMDRGGSLASKDSRSMSKIDELNYAALAKQNAEMPGDPIIEKNMKAIEARYGIGQAQQQKQYQQEQPSPERSVIQGAQPQRTSQPTMSRTTSSIRSILTTVVPESERQQILSEINAFDPTGERQEEVLASLQKRYAGKRTPSAPVSGKPAERNEDFNTPLSESQKAGFAEWRKKNAHPQDTGEDYDLQGAYLDGVSKEANGHMTDKFKKPSHVTFSSGSKYSTPETPGGEWKELGDGKWSYTPSSWMAKDTGRMERLKEYFAKYEKGNTLIIPEKQPSSSLPPQEELAKYGITPVDGGKVYEFKAGLLTPKTYLKPEQVMTEYKRLKDAETAKANSPEERKKAEDRRKQAEYERMFGKGFGYGS